MTDEPKFPLWIREEAARRLRASCNDSFLWSAESVSDNFAALALCKAIQELMPEPIDLDLIEARDEECCGEYVAGARCPACPECLKSIPPQPSPHTEWKWRLGDLVRKRRGSSWRGRVAGFYSTEHTPYGYVVESAFEPLSVQAWPETALIEWEGL